MKKEKVTMSNEEAMLWLVNLAEHEGEEVLISAEDAKALQMGINAIKALEQESKTGHWILYHPLQADDPGAYRCSVCGYGDWGLDPEIDKFCFNCGARMAESEEEE